MVNALPQTVAVVPPAAGETVDVPFTLEGRYTDPDGHDDLHVVDIRILDVCRARYHVTANRMDLLGEGFPLIEGAAPGTPGTIEHAGCRLDIGNSSVTLVRDEIRVSFNLTLFEEIPASRDVLLHARDRALAPTGWITHGTISVLP